MKWKQKKKVASGSKFMMVEAYSYITIVLVIMFSNLRLLRLLLWMPPQPTVIIESSNIFRHNFHKFLVLKLNSAKDKKQKRQVKKTKKNGNETENIRNTGAIVIAVQFFCFCFFIH